jgi:hypothetical protein
MYFRTCNCKSQEDCVRKSQIRKLSHLRKVRPRKSNKLLKSANLRICDLLSFFCGPATFASDEKLYQRIILCQMKTF